MLVICEGIDRVGKSTLCGKLDEVDGFAYLRNKPLRHAWSRETEIERLKAFFDASKVSGNALVADRFHVSELVYGRKYRSYDALEEVLELDSLMASYGGVLLVHVMPTSLEKSSAEAGHDLTLEYAQFCDFIDNKTSLPVHRTTWPELDRTAELIAEGVR